MSHAGLTFSYILRLISSDSDNNYNDPNDWILNANACKFSDPIALIEPQNVSAYSSSVLSADWFNRAAWLVAPDLLGRTLVRCVDGEVIRGQIVETEAYEAGDPAMYAYRNKTERNAVVFGPAGVAYVYRIYRKYCCFNIVTDRDRFASTILIRAVHLQQRPSWLASSQETGNEKRGNGRKGKPEKLHRVAAGPGKLCRSLKIDESLKGLPIHPSSGIWVEAGEPVSTAEITQTTRIGLSKGVDIPWRWYVTDAIAVSKKKTDRL